MTIPPLTLRSDKGAKLTAEEFDDNHRRHEQRIQALIDNPPPSDDIVSFSLVGTTAFLLHKQSGATIGPIPMPRSAPRQPVRAAVTGTTFTPALADAGHFIPCTHADGCIVTIPSEADVAFTPGEEMTFFAGGAGPVVLVPDDGVSFEPIPGFETATAQRSSWLMAKKIGADQWAIAGWLAEEEDTGGTS